MTEAARAWKRVRSTARQLTTPLHPDDYLRLLHPLWTARELRGRVDKVIQETEDAATLVIRPGWGWRHDHRPGQYVGIGIPVDGTFHWRSYSVSSPPKRRGRHIAITVRAMPEGFLSSHTTAEADGATTVLEAGESVGVNMPYGCRMGICHTCTVTLKEGTVRDLRSGEEFTGPNEPVQTCVTALVGDCTLDI